MTGWLILFMCCVGIAAICLGIDLIIERKTIKKHHCYVANYWAILVIAICGVLALVFGLLALVIPIDSAQRIADITAILEIDPTNDVAIANLVEWQQAIERYGIFAEKWLVREEIAELLTAYGG
ncbi:MAG: hypothetical protein J6A25_01145 [Lachnospiraceae bacterium]|nr:hypothetical protein [Lachnospiraceae bacterium]